MKRWQSNQTHNYSLSYDCTNNNACNVRRRWLLLDLSSRRRRPFRSLRHFRHRKNARQMSLAKETKVLKTGSRRNISLMSGLSLLGSGQESRSSACVLSSSSLKYGCANLRRGSIKEIALLFKGAFRAWNEKDPFRESAVIAYYAIFSMPGLLVLVLTLGGYFFGSDTVTGQLHRQISGAMGNDTADLAQEMMKKAGGSAGSIWARIIGIITILVGATGVFVQFLPNPASGLFLNTASFHSDSSFPLPSCSWCRWW